MMLGQQERKRRIGQLMLEEELITQAQLNEALRVQRERGGKIVEVLVNLGYIGVDEFVEFLSRQPGIASIDLSTYEVPRDLLALIPREFAVKHEVFPIDKMGKYLTVGMACPLDSSALEQLMQLTGLKVRPLLCPAQAIRAAIQEYYPKEGDEKARSEAEATQEILHRVEHGLRFESIGSLVRKVTALPPLPETVQRVREVIDDPNSSVADVARIVGLDPPVSAKLLSLANSSAYGFPSKVATIPMAVTLLGLRETYSVVLSLAAKEAFHGMKNFDYRIFWEDAMFAAAAANGISRATGLARGSGVFAAGLLHNIGVLVLAQVAPERYDRIPKNLCFDVLVEAERDEFMLAHPEAGYILATAWNLPPEIAMAMRFHHDPDMATEAQDVVRIVSLASGLIECRKGCLDRDAYVKRNESTMGIVKIDANRVFEVSEQAEAAIR